MESLGKYKRIMKYPGTKVEAEQKLQPGPEKF